MSTIILLVEDDSWYGQQQQRVLSEAGYQVEWVRDAQAAMDRIDAVSFGALVVDMLLTHNTVMALLHELQASRDTAGLPVVMYTAQASSLDHNALASYGVVALLDKTTMHPRDTVFALKKVGI